MKSFFSQCKVCPVFFVKVYFQREWLLQNGAKARSCYSEEGLISNSSLFWSHLKSLIHKRNLANPSSLKVGTGPTLASKLTMDILAWSFIASLGLLAAQPSVLVMKMVTLREVIKNCFCKSLPFFYFLTFEKADCSIFVLLVVWLVGRLVGWSVDVTINSFNIYRHKSPLLTQYHSIPISTNQ